MPAFAFRSTAATLATLLSLSAVACAESTTGPDAGPNPTTGNPTTGNPTTGNPTTGNPTTGNPTTGNPTTGTPTNGAVPAAVQGGWRWGSVSPTTFWNDQTGVYQGSAYGMSDHYEFAANGTYKEYVFIYTQSYGCRTQAWVEMEGKVSFTAATFTTQITKGRFKTTNSCAASSNMDRSMTSSEMAERSKTREYSLKTDASGKTYLQILDGRYDRAQ